MKDEESQSSINATLTTSAAVRRQSSSDLFSSSSSCSSSPTTSTGSAAGIFSRSRYKFWALAAILLLAFWSLFTGSVTLNWNNLNNNNNNPLSSSNSPSLHDDLDILEVEEREKLVRRLWDVYTHSSTIRLPRFWEEAFEAAYQHLTHEAVGVRNAALSEIAKMSILSLDLDPPAAPSSTRQRSKLEKQTRKDEKAMVTAARTRRL